MRKTMKGIEVPVIGFAAYSGTGKTTLLTRIVEILKERNLRVGIVKHAHHNFDIDYPGKDSYRLRKAGASQVLIGSSLRWALMVENDVKEPKPLEFHIKNMDLDNLDLILIEGFKLADIPKIEIHRPSLGNPPLYPEDKNVIALATDADSGMQTSIPILDLNDPAAIADFIVDRFLDNVVMLKRSGKINKDL